MSIDRRLGEQLAEIIRNAETLRVEDAMFTYDPFRQSEDVGYDPVVLISPGNVQHQNLGHQNWSRDVSLSLIMLVKQPPNMDADWFDLYLQSWDAVIAAIETVDQVTAIETEQRYSLDASQNQARVISQAMIQLNHQA